MQSQYFSLLYDAIKSGNKQHITMQLKWLTNANTHSTSDLQVACFVA